MTGNDFSTVSQHASFILFCAQAMSEGRNADALMCAEKLSDSNLPLARALVGRVLLSAGELEKSKPHFAEAIKLTDNRTDPTSQYIIEYCICWLADFDDEQQMQQQFRRALSNNPPVHVLDCLPLYEDVFTTTSKS